MRYAFRYQANSSLRAINPEKRRDARSIPALEPLEGRQLLSFLQPFGNKFARVKSGGVLDVISVSGPGQVFTKKIDRSTITISLVGTTQDSTVTISSLGTHPQTPNSPLQIGSINVPTGRLGSFQGLTTADLLGPLTPLLGPVTSLQFDALGPAAQIDVNGNLGQFTVNRAVVLGSTGHINVSNDLTTGFSVSRDVTLDGGQINIGRDLAGTLSIGGNLTLLDGGQFSVGRNLVGASAGTAATPSAAGGATVTGNLRVDSNSKVLVGGNVSTLTVGGNIEVSSGSVIAIGGNVNTLTVSGGAGAQVTGNVILASSGLITVNGNLSTFTVGSNLITSGGGQVHVHGDLGTLSVAGIIQGKGSEDIVVGDDLGQLTVLGGGNGVFSLETVNIDVTKNIQGLDVRNGMIDSLITAGILIDGGTPGAGTNGWNIGPDGPVAVFDSEIRAGFEIRNVVIGGDVVSDLPENPSSGRVTRIVAGEDRNGNFSPGGIIDTFQIVGNLVDSVLAASVAPFQGHYHQPAGAIEVGFLATPATATSTSTSTATGSTTTTSPMGVIPMTSTLTNTSTSTTVPVPTSPTSTTSSNSNTTTTPATTTTQGTTTTSGTSTTTTSTLTIPIPAQPVTVQSGATDVGLVVATPPGAPVNPTQLAQLQGSPLPVFTAPPFANTPDIVLPNGAINPTFAAPLQLVPPAASAGTKLPLPSKSTILGTVITASPHVPGTDFAGIFAFNTNGVLVGLVPTSAPVMAT